MATMRAEFSTTPCLKPEMQRVPRLSGPISAAECHPVAPEHCRSHRDGSPLCRARCPALVPHRRRVPAPSRAVVLSQVDLAAQSTSDTFLSHSLPRVSPETRRGWNRQDPEPAVLTSVDPVGRTTAERWVGLEALPQRWRPQLASDQASRVEPALQPLDHPLDMKKGSSQKKARQGSSLGVAQGGPVRTLGSPLGTAHQRHHPPAFAPTGIRAQLLPHS